MHINNVVLFRSWDKMMMSKRGQVNVARLVDQHCHLLVICDYNAVVVNIIFITL